MLPFAWIAALTLGCALITSALWMIGLPRLTEPDLDPAEAKVTYASLATPRAAVLVGAFSAASSWTAVTNVPIATLPVWLVLSTLGLGLAAIDGWTTWIPARLTRIVWLVMAGAVASTRLLGLDWTDLVRTVVGAAAAGGLYLLLWIITRGGFGFGDVRYVPLVAAPAASVSIDTLIAAMLLGMVLALAHALVRLAGRRGGMQPWAPSLALGAFLGAAMAT